MEDELRLSARGESLLGWGIPLSGVQVLRVMNSEAMARASVLCGVGKRVLRCASLTGRRPEFLDGS